MLGNWMASIECLSQYLENKMQIMFLRLFFSQMVAQKLVEDQGIDFPQTLASLSNESVSAIYKVIRRLGGSVSGKKSDSKES